jgi:predicted DNA-binding transcriptional regulator AlpA
MSAEPGLQIFDADTSATPTASTVKPAVRLMKQPDLFALMSVSKSTGHRLLGAGKIGPKPIKLTPGCVRFDSDEVHAWLSARKPDGSLHDARTWPAVWEMLKKRR